jgi:hypothetical protein
MLQLLVPDDTGRQSRARRIARTVFRIVKVGAAAAEVGYGALIARSWLRYGRRAPAIADEVDPLLDRVMPDYDVVERHHVRVNAPSGIVLAAACDADPNSSAIVRLIFRARAFVLGARTQEVSRGGLLNQMKALGWTTIGEREGREIVMGAVTQPWKSDVVFRGLPAEEFVTFHEPGYVKIAWTLRVDPIDATSSIFRTETRAGATDPDARRRFRWYWARFSPGIVLIRHVLVRSVKRTAERRVR